MRNRAAMPAVKRSETTPLKHRRTLRILLGLAGMVLLSALLFLLFVGRWLVVEDPLEKAQAIVVLSGRMPLRAMEAAKLYREGYAPKCMADAFHGTWRDARSHGDLLHRRRRLQLAQVLMHEGVPADAIRVLEPPIINTADEIAAVSAALGARKGQDCDHRDEQGAYAPRAHPVAPARCKPRASDYTRQLPTIPSNRGGGGVRRATPSMSFANFWEY